MTSADKELAPEEVFQRAVALHEQGRLDEAEHLYRSLLKADPAEIGYLHNLGVLCIHQGKYEDAVKLVREVLGHQPDLALAHNTLGVVLGRLGRFEEAEACCREALRLAPDYAEAHNTLAHTLTALGRFNEAEASCRKALHLKPEYAEAHYNLGTALLSLCRPAEAERCYREALRLKPENPAAFHNLGNALAHQGKLSEAAAAFGRAAALNPKNNADALANWFHLRRRIYGYMAAMINDELRNEAFDCAIRANVKPGDVVAEIGSGVGALLAMSAARAGAAHVWSCEADEVTASMAMKVVEDNGLSDRITIIPKHSHNLEIGVDLPRKVDLVAMELVDASLLGEGIIKTIQHAVRHLARSGAVIIPRGAQIYVMLVESPELYRLQRVDTTIGFDLKSINRFGPYSAFRERIGKYEYRELSEPVKALGFDFTQPHTLVAKSQVVELDACATGLAHALVAWFEIDLDGRHSIDSHPRRRGCHWMNPVQLLDMPRTVEPGNRLRILAQHDTNSVHFFVEP
jgi:Flp pilus assembly protein TadD